MLVNDVLLIDLAYRGGLMAIVTLLYAALIRRTAPPVLAAAPDGISLAGQLVAGLLFGGAAALAMLPSLPAGPGIPADGHGVLVALAGPFGGPVAAVVATVLGAACRLHLGGLDASAGVLGIVMAGAAGMVFLRGARPDPAGLALPPLLLLGLMVSAGAVRALTLPVDAAQHALAGTRLTDVIVNVAGVVALGWLLTRERRRLAAENDLRHAALTDPLTGLSNRRAFRDALANECARTVRSGRPLCVALVDIDHFKRINDTFGHEAGDTALVALGQVLRDGLRGGDLVARYGGEEFAILLPDTPPQAAAILAERLRLAVQRAAVGGRDRRLALTVSIGAAGVAGGALGDGDRADADDLLKLADEALYRAKAAGRNRAVVAEAAAPPPCAPADAKHAAA